MYTSYFGFKENPFSLTPDPHYLYLSPHHKEAFDHLVYGINERKGFIVITGGIGTGKTTLCRALLGTLESSTKTALVFNAYISDMELLRTINQEFGIEAGEPDQSKKDHNNNLDQFLVETFGKGGEEGAPDRSKKDYIDNLNKFLLETFSKGGNAVLLIDEAQEMTPDVLSELRILSSADFDATSLLTVVLSGDGRLPELLRHQDLIPLGTRIRTRLNTEPASREELSELLSHALAKAGNATLMTAELKDTLVDHAAGNYRLLMTMGGELLAHGMAHELGQLDEKCYLEAFQPTRPRPASKKKARVGR